MRLVNALLPAVQTEAILAETIGLADEQRAAAYRQQLVTAGVEDDATPGRLQPGVAEELGDDDEVGAATHQGRGEGVAQDVGG